MHKNPHHYHHNKWILRHLFSLHRSQEKLIPKETLAQLRALSKMPLDQLFHLLKAKEEGLTERDVLFRQKKGGLNEILSEKPPSWFTLLFRNISNPFVLLLLALSVISFFLHNYQAVVIILIMVLLGIIMRFIQEERSNRAILRLKALVTTNASVIRIKNGIPIQEEVSFKELVPGDILSLSAGDMIPADIRILSARDLFISQSSLTGEAFGVEKCGEGGKIEEGERIFDLPNICLMGTNVTSGVGKAIVLHTGLRTYFASIAESILKKRPLTSFDIGINRVSWLLIRVIACMVPAIFIINGLNKGDWFTSLLFALSVAVGLTPEMLPMIVTTNLAKGAMQMSKNHIIVKQISSIQNFGAMDILCTDKTGTLTQDKIVLEKYLNLEGIEDTEVLKFAYLNSYHQSSLKNLLDVAILNHTFDHEELASYPKIDEIPFDFSRRRMSVVVSKGENTDILITKGSFHSVLACCTQGRIQGKTVPLTPELIEASTKLQNQLNMQGFRTLAAAIKEIPKAKETEYRREDESSMTLIGILVFLDPPKQSAQEAIQSLRDYGVSVKVLTGDDALVTKQICEWVGLPVQGILKGLEMTSLSEEEKIAKIEKNTIFAELSPLQKSEIIALLKKSGHIVGFLGDGINDAAALREADIGISVDSAVDIAKESSDIVMLQKNLVFLGLGVIEGRRTFANTLKYIKMAISSNFGNVLSVVGASFLFPFLPILPLQLLIQNLLYDISQLAIPFDRVDSDFLETPKSWNPEGIVKFMLFLGPVSSIFDYTTFAVMFFFFGANSVLKQSLFQTGWFVEGLFSQVLIVHMLRTSHLPFIQSFPAPILLLTTILVMTIGLYIPYSPINASIGMIPLPLSYFSFLIPILLSYTIFTQLMKFWFIRRFKFWI